MSYYLALPLSFLSLLVCCSQASVFPLWFPCVLCVCLQWCFELARVLVCLALDWYSGLTLDYQATWEFAMPNNKCTEVIPLYLLCLHFGSKLDSQCSWHTAISVQRWNTLAQLSFRVVSGQSFFVCSFVCLFFGRARLGAWFQSWCYKLTMVPASYWTAVLPSHLILSKKNNEQILSSPYWSVWTIAFKSSIIIKSWSLMSLSNHVRLLTFITLIIGDEDCLWAHIGEESLVKHKKHKWLIAQTF